MNYPVFEIWWESDYPDNGDSGSCFVEEFISTNEESLSEHDIQTLIELKPGGRGVVMGGACYVGRYS